MQLTRTHRVLIGVVVAGAVIIAGIGFAGSYAAVRELALEKGFGSFSYVFPVGIDAGICVLLALDLLLTWMRIPFPLLRQTAWLLTAATIAFNGAASWPDPLGVGMHAVIPILFVVSVEAARHAVGRIADITADKHMEGVRLTRWLLSPLPTFRLWRRMKLWELRSYEQVIKLEQDRLIYQSRLQARFGRSWKRKAPVEALMPLRLAKYGIPIADTAAAGLAAAGIEPMLLPPAPATATAPALPAAAGGDGTDDRGPISPAPEDLGQTTSGPPNGPHETQTAATGVQDPGTDHPARTNLHKQNPETVSAPAPASVPASVPASDAGHEAEAEAATAAAAGIPGTAPATVPAPAPAEQPQQHPSPWFAAPAGPGQHQVPAQTQGGEQAPYGGPEQYEDHQVMVPSGPGRSRPLGGYHPDYDAEFGPDFTSAEGADADFVLDDDAYYDAFRKCAGANGAFPTPLQFGSYLEDLYGQQLPVEELEMYTKRYEERFQLELDEYIA
ncbi:DUF2637 domain-containing protein [Streptomyces sp. NPDC091272]|uniref:DUF2637 domain-containing protein n=1 Tax=Streptomyces sp. NPDC091272 TaxID=3365981 RepID=UPI0038245517